MCEKYCVQSNKWSELPGLKMIRCSPGSVLLSPMVAFCFCGRQYFKRNLNTIESIRIETDSEWKILALNDHVPNTNQIGVAQFEGKLMMFGGDEYWRVTSQFSLEGELIVDHSGDKGIPGQMNSHSFTVGQDGKIYAVEQEEGSKNPGEWRVKVFDGKKWN